MKKLMILVKWATFLWLVLFLLPSCDRFLDAKSDYSLSTPESLEDLRALLDNESLINQNFPGLIEVGADNFYLDDNQLSLLPLPLQEAYLWKEGVEATELASWAKPYEAIMAVNVVLENISRIKIDNENLYNQTLGEAYFVRGLYYFYLSQIFCMPYDVTKADQMLGLPLKYSSDLTEKIFRSSLKETYDQIIYDLEQAITHLPKDTHYITRANKGTAYAALSRVYLSMARYDNAEQMADEALFLNDNLLDYNTLVPTSTLPFNRANPELMYLGFSILSSNILVSNGTFISQDLYDLYDSDDLRKNLFFTQNSNGNISFKGHYAGQRTSYFAGFAVDELYLTKAECLARRGEVDGALSYLNGLLFTRWRSGTYVDLDIDDQNILLNVVLTERRKELLFRGVRWMDLRRLNKFDEQGIILSRKSSLNGYEQEYLLLPNDKLYSYAIPENVIKMSGIEQNDR